MHLAATCTVLVKEKVANWDYLRLLREDKITNPSRLYYREVRKFANSVNTYAHTYCHRCCAHFVNFTNVSTRIARMLRERTLLTSLREVFVCVSLPFFLISTVSLLCRQFNNRRNLAEQTEDLVVQFARALGWPAIRLCCHAFNNCCYTVLVLAFRLGMCLY